MASYLLVVGKRGPKPRTELDRWIAFMAKVEHGDGCWLWKDVPIKRGGYGQFYVDGRIRRAHRVMWEYMDGGPLEPHDHVLHHCDTPLCVRPDHLFLGDQAVNMADMKAKGRSRNQFSH